MSRFESDTRTLIVVPALNEAEGIVAVMDTLLAGAPPGTRLVVADGGSTDGTRDLVEGYSADNPAVTLIANDARIQSAGINRAVGLHGNGARYLLRADAHAVYPEDYCRILLDEIRGTGAASVTVAMQTLPRGGFSTGVAAAQNSVLGTGGSAHRTGGGTGRYVDHGHHALMRLDAFREIGGYDPAQSHNEDAEFDHRLRQAGRWIWLTGRTALGYVPRGTPGALFRQYRAYGRGRAMTVLKHRMRPRARQVAPLIVAPAVTLAALGVVLAPFGAAWLWLCLPAALWAAICLVYGIVLAGRAGDISVAWAGPAAMIMHFGWSLGFLGQIAYHASGRAFGGGGRRVRHDR